MKNQMSSKSQGQVAYFSRKKTSLKYKIVTLSDAPTTLCRPLCHRRPIAQRDCFAPQHPLCRKHCSLPLRRHWEYHTLGGRRWEYDALSTHWEYHTLSAARWEYDALSVRARSWADTERASYSQHRVVLLCQFLVLAENRFWFYILMYLEYNTVVALC